MRLKWKPGWYELDQSVVVGDCDYFYLNTEETQFANDLASNDDIEIVAEIKNITHSQLGKVVGIVTIGLDYTVYLIDGTRIVVNAEENPGDIQNNSIQIEDWSFDVEISISEKTGLSSLKRLNITEKKELKLLNENRLRNYKRLLNIEEL